MKPITNKEKRKAAQDFVDMLREKQAKVAAMREIVDSFDRFYEHWMAQFAKSARENGKKGGRPKGKK
jgi:predicted nucleic-acid-binding protein